MHWPRLKCCCSNRLLLVSRDLTILRAHLLAGYTQDPLVSIAGKEVDAYSLGTDKLARYVEGGNSSRKRELTMTSQKVFINMKYHQK
jgi:hypothetical protein